MAAGSTQTSTARRDRSRHDALAVLCKLAGAPDVETYLGVPPGASTKDALVRLERKRRELEVALQDPAQAREAELFLECYGALRDHLGRTSDAQRRPDAGAPDYYQVLGLPPEASYVEIERAWRRLQTSGRDVEPHVTQAWRVLGDPLNRAHYDRARRELAPVDPPSDVGEPHDAAPTASAEISGAGSRDVLLEGDEASVVTVPFVVRGEGRWRATITTDHPAVTTTPERRVEVGPGRHTLVVRVDPTKLRGKATTATITLQNPHEQHVVVVRARRPGAARRAEPWILAGAAVLLVTLGWGLGMGTKVLSSTPQPATQGDVAQIPSAAACFFRAREPLPRWVDVHVDGFGHPTGFTFGGAAAPEAEACVREALAELDFPSTADGLPAFHRYQIAGASSATPPSAPGSP